VTRRSCEQCGREYTLVKGFVYRSELPHAVYYVACHHHDAAREAWIDVILGTFGVDDWGDHVTFGARVGPIAGQSEPGATLVDAAAPYGDSEMFGMKLTRAAALQHERLSEYWDIVDFILMEDPTVYAHVYQ
jgi:hypothetical protein